MLALFHYAIQSKADVTEAVFLAGLFVWMMAWRRLRRRWQQQLWPLLPLALGAAVAATAIEAAWYAVRNHVNPMLVWTTNFDFSYGPRPAVWVLIVGVLLFAVAALRRLRKRRAMPRGAMRRA